MTGHRCKYLLTSAACVVAFFTYAATARTFNPPARLSAKPGSIIGADREKGAPVVLSVASSAIADRFQIEQGYSRAAHAHVAVVGAYTVQEPKGTHLVASWSMGFLPVTLQFSNGRCFLLTADYNNSALSNGKLAPVGCEGPRGGDKPLAPPTSDQPLQLIGSSWGFDAWTSDQGRTALVTAPRSTIAEPLFTARMAVSAIMAMNSPDASSGNVTLVGKIAGKLTVVTLEVGW
jgi:hypothetical protein